MMTGVPAEYAGAVDAERARLWLLVERARSLARQGDRPALRALADEVRQRVTDGSAASVTGGHLNGHVADITAALDDVYDEVFPVRDPGDPADVLDAPWPTQRPTDLLASSLAR